MAEQNGNVKWVQLISVVLVLCSILATVLYAFDGRITSCDKLRVCEDQRIYERVENYQREIVQRLTRIEAKMEDGIK